jgi:hypothetical protein
MSSLIPTQLEVYKMQPLNATCLNGTSHQQMSHAWGLPSSFNSSNTEAAASVSQVSY